MKKVFSSPAPNKGTNYQAKAGMERKFSLHSIWGCVMKRRSFAAFTHPHEESRKSQKGLLHLNLLLYNLLLRLISSAYFIHFEKTKKFLPEDTRNARNEKEDGLKGRKMQTNLLLFLFFLH
jgi:hypothetical protein